jgi:hypothetical protein
MNIAVVSYSYTGNSTRFAEVVAKELAAEHIRVQTKRPVNYGTITLDLLFQRSPEIDLSPEELGNYDLILLVGPVWMGMVAFPLRRCLRELKKHPRPYGFLSVSGGADGNNPKLAEELTRRTGARPQVLLDQHIRELLPPEPAPTRDDTSNYQLTEADCARFAGRAVEKVRLAYPGL